MIKELWKNYSRYINLSKNESRLAILFGILGAFLETISIYYLTKLITIFDNNSSISKLKFISISNESNYDLAIIFIITAIFSSAAYFISNINIVKAKSIIERSIREEITKLTLNIKWEYYLKLSQGDISKSIISEGQNISEGYLYFISAITYSSIAITYFIFCLIFIPDTFIILLLYAFFAFRIYINYSKKAQKLGEKLSQTTSNIGNLTSSIFNNLKYIRTKSQDNIAQKESKEIFLKFANSYEKALTASYKSKFVTEILTIIFIFLSLVYIFLNKLGSSNFLLSLSIFIRMTPKVYNAQSRFLDSLAMISWPKIHKEKMIWAKKNEEVDNFKNKSQINFNGSIKFESVSFKYPNSQNIIENLNLSISRNECLGIIGKSGSGKSTLLDLITGLINPTTGNIYISGTKINQIDLNNWRKIIGIVMQDNYFKNSTVASNIALGEKKIDKAKVKIALIKSNSWDFVKNLPNGMNEIVLDKGMRFSGGQRQKLALARAIYSEPKILILDEPSSSLDENSQNDFIMSIKNLIGKMTIIIVSHKKEVVKICDRVVIFKDKKIIEL